MLQEEYLLDDDHPRIHAELDRRRKRNSDEKATKVTSDSARWPEQHSALAESCGLTASLELCNMHRSFVCVLSPRF